MRYTKENKPRQRARDKKKSSATNKKQPKRQSLFFIIYMHRGEGQGARTWHVSVLIRDRVLDVYIYSRRKRERKSHCTKRNKRQMRFMKKGSYVVFSLNINQKGLLVFTV